MLKKISRKIFHFINRKAFESEYQFVPLAAIGFFGFIVYYFIWGTVAPNEYENIYLRIIGGSLCFFLMFKNYWPTRLLPLLPFYWYATLLYCFPFFFTFMLFKNPTSYIWLITTMTGLFLLMLLVDWISLIIIVSLGVSLSWFTYFFTSANIVIPETLLETFPAFLMVIIAGSIFIYRTEAVHREKLKVMEAIAMSVAHELRTPFATIRLAASNIKSFFPRLVEGYCLAKKAQLPVQKINPDYFYIVTKIPDTIESETQAAFTFIDMLLTNVNPKIEAGRSVIFSMADCVEEALKRYPFKKQQINLVEWVRAGDFQVKGQFSLMIHVLFNLIRNALYYLEKSAKGEDAKIFIWLEPGKTHHTLYFKDTGTGIPAKILPHVFDRFYTQTYHGAGIGLTFCKMVMQDLGGNITCDSEEGRYTLFTLSFPALKQPHED